MLRETTGPTIDAGEEAGSAARSGGVRIRCPRCAWEPADEDTWLCSLCGFVWNTFHTRGMCPGCDRRWRETQCLRCEQWSPHEDWYVEEERA